MNAVGTASLALSAPEGATRRGVVVMNVGTPDAPTVPAVRRYLREFLGDPAVVDLPGPARWALLNLIILPFRPKKSAHAYQAIWTEQGSPLLLNSVAQVEALRHALPDMEVVLAMRYGNPSLEAAVATLRERGVTDAVVVPMYPQEAQATSGTSVQAARASLPGARVVPAFFSSRGFIDAAASRVRDVVERSGADRVLFSYHGLPVRQVQKMCQTGCAGSRGEPTACAPITEASARCYRAQCYATSQAIGKAAGVLAMSETAFQSRLKGATWLSPFTDEALVAMARRGVKRVAVACPSFVADCLETLEEIGQRGKETFLEAGGEHLELVPAVNDAPQFIEALAGLVRAQWERSTP